MKRSLLTALCLAVSLSFSAGGAMAPVLTVAAASTTTVTGTINAQTTAKTIYLDTSSGTMQIMFDTTTDITKAGVLMQGASVDIEVYRGSDGYMHSKKITAKGGDTVTVDDSSTATVEGTVVSGTTGTILYLSTSIGTIPFKIDMNASDFTAAGTVQVGSHLFVTFGVGSDGYPHVLKAATTAAGAVYTKNSSAASASAGRTSQTSGTSSAAGTAQTYSYQGTANSNSSDDTMYLSVPNAGTMTIKLDSNTAMTSKVYSYGHTLKVTAYNGGDGYLHAASVEDTSFAPKAVTVDTSNPIPVTGTIASGNELNTLTFTGEDGTSYKIRLDGNTQSSIRWINGGRKLKITVGVGNDGYLHAISITDPAKEQSAVSANGMISVTGSAASNSTSETMYLGTVNGNMTVKIDSNTNITSKMYRPGHTISAVVYNGGDGYLHAASITDGDFKSSSATVNTSKVYAITGTVNSDSTVGRIKLSGQDGQQYTIIVDDNTQTLVKCLKSGIQITLTMGVGSDGYLHAITIK